MVYEDIKQEIEDLFDEQGKRFKATPISDATAELMLEFIETQQQRVEALEAENKELNDFKQRAKTHAVLSLAKDRELAGRTDKLKDEIKGIEADRLHYVEQAKTLQSQVSLLREALAGLREEFEHSVQASMIIQEALSKTDRTA